MSGPEQAATVTPGQAAYEAFWANREPPIGTVRHVPADWNDEQPARRAQWEAAAKAAIERKTGSERVAELVTEGNELRRELAEVRKLAADLERDRNTLFDAADYERKRVIDLTALVSEILASWAAVNGRGPAVQAQIDKWRGHAGLPPAAVTAGTEHLAEKIRGLAIPDEETL